MKTQDPARPVPQCAEEITPAWLSHAVQAVAPDATATRVEVLEAHSGTTGRARLRVTWDTDELPRAVFAKLAPTDPTQRVMAIELGMGIREAHFYEALAPEMPVRVPRPITSTWTSDGQAYLMLVEDLESSGCSFPTAAGADDVSFVRATVEALAHLHAHFWESPRFASDLRWIERPMRGDIGRSLISTGLQTFGAQQTDAFRQLATMYIDHNEPVNDILVSGPPTLIHGDPHMGNLFRDGPQTGFLDWACVARAPGLRDIGYFLGASVATELRRTHERSLIERYVQVLQDRGVRAPSMDDAWNAYRLHVTNAWVAATATLAAGERMQTLEVGRRALDRANAAIEDLETVPALTQALSAPR